MILFRYFRIFTLLLLFVSCGHVERSSRTPSSFLNLKTNYTCNQLISLLFGNPYSKKYPLEDFTYEEAIKAFQNNLDSRAHKLKIGSQPFLRLQTKDRKAPTVVLLHGFSDSAGSMRELAEMYYQKGFNVVAPLLRDHGLKDELQEQALRNSSLKHWREDVDFALSVGKALSPDGKVHVGGYSMGATLTMDLSWRHPSLVASRTLYAPLFRENGLVLQPAVFFLSKFTNGFFYKQVDETDIFYKRMSYRQTHQMHKLTRQVRPYLLRKKDDIPTAVFRTEDQDETTVDDDYINFFVKEYGIEQHHYIHHNIDSNQKRLANPVLHRDLPNATVNSNGEENPALEMIYQGVNNFLDEISL